MIRNAVRLFEYGLDWTYVSNIALGLFFLFIIIWAIISVWRKNKQNILFCLIALIVIFIVRLGVGIPANMEKSKHMSNTQYAEELTVFIAQVVVHVSGIIATWVLFSRS